MPCLDLDLDLPHQQNSQLEVTGRAKWLRWWLYQARQVRRGSLTLDPATHRAREGAKVGQEKNIRSRL